MPGNTTAAETVWIERESLVGQRVAGEVTA